MRKKKPAKKTLKPPTPFRTLSAALKWLRSQEYWGIESTSYYAGNRRNKWRVYGPDRCGSTEYVYAADPIAAVEALRRKVEGGK